MKKATRERQSTPREWQNVDQHRAILCLRFCGANRYFLLVMLRRFPSAARPSIATLGVSLRFASGRALVLRIEPGCACLAPPVAGFHP
ncbi:hypothetical protein [Ralstonia sp. GP101]|uniref:hypothetical protein n=1 Tax=Ralstonia sp. GP101 TaxID=3035146 RepID=UPI0038926426